MEGPSVGRSGWHDLAKLLAERSCKSTQALQVAMEVPGGLVGRQHKQTKPSMVLFLWLSQTKATVECSPSCTRTHTVQPSGDSRSPAKASPAAQTGAARAPSHRLARSPAPP